MEPIFFVIMWVFSMAYYFGVRIGEMYVDLMVISDAFQIADEIGQEQ